MGAMRLSASRRGAGYRIGGGLLLLVVLAAAVLIGSVHAAPSTKNVTESVHVTDATAATNALNTFTVTLANDKKSNQTFGSANAILPTGFVATAAAVVSPATGWMATPNSSAGDVELRSTANAIAPGHSLVVTVTVDPATITGCTNSAWSAVVKQSNDFNGTNNFFTLLTAGSQLTPLGSFDFAPIETVLQPPPPPAAQDPIHVPQILVNQAAPISIKALDTCGKPDTDYSGTTLAPKVDTPTRLVNATFSGLTWATNNAGDRVGSASVTPTDVEVQDNVVVTDPESNISATTPNHFDVVEKICAISGSTCTWSNKKGTITATSTVGGDNGNTASLGLGFRSENAVCTIAGKATGVVGDLIQIVPVNYADGGTYTVTLTYAKSIAPSGPATGFNVCKNTDPDGGGAWVPIPQCGKVPVAPCAAPSKTSGGTLQVTLYLEPGDPLSGGFG